MPAVRIKTVFQNRQIFLPDPTSPPHHIVIEKRFMKINNYKIVYLNVSTYYFVFVKCRTFSRKKNQNTYFNSIVNIIIMAGQYVPCEPELHKGTLMQTQSALQLSQKECRSRQHNTLILH